MGRIQARRVSERLNGSLKPLISNGCCCGCGCRRLARVESAARGALGIPERARGGVDCGARRGAEPVKETAVLLPRSQSSLKIGLYLVALAALLTMVIGISRIYLSGSLSDRRSWRLVHRCGLGHGLLGADGVALASGSAESGLTTQAILSAVLLHA
jgi:hypothetical protein